MGRPSVKKVGIPPNKREKKDRFQGLSSYLRGEKSQSRRGEGELDATEGSKRGCFTAPRNERGGGPKIGLREGEKV